MDMETLKAKLKEAERQLEWCDNSARAGQCSDDVLGRARNDLRLLRARLALDEYGPRGEKPWLHDHEAALEQEYAEARAEAVADGQGWLALEIERATVRPRMPSGGRSDYDV